MSDNVGVCRSTGRLVAAPFARDLEARQWLGAGLVLYKQHFKEEEMLRAQCIWSYGDLRKKRGGGVPYWGPR